MLGLVIVADVFDYNAFGDKIATTKTVFGPTRSYDAVQAKLKEFHSNLNVERELGVTLRDSKELSIRVDTHIEPRRSLASSLCLSAYEETLAFD